MGLRAEDIELLIVSKKLGVNFDNSLTIGRQRLLLRKNEFKKILLSHQLLQPSDTFKKERFAESFFELLGAKQVSALDASDYEGAELVHDLNVPMESSYFSKYDVVFDGGSLEHIFNFSTAIKNCMNLVKPGGHFICSSPTNNFMGHGFYQFSPELYFRIFNSENGFSIKKMFLYVINVKKSFYEVLDPAVVKSRVKMINKEPAMLFVIAEKTEEKAVFSTVPQQYDYEHHAWQQKEKLTTSQPPTTKSNLSKIKKAVIRYFQKNKNHLDVMAKETGTANPKHIRKQ